MHVQDSRKQWIAPISPICVPAALEKHVWHNLQYQTSFTLPYKSTSHHLSKPQHSTFKMTSVTPTAMPWGDMQDWQVISMSHHFIVSITLSSALRADDSGWLTFGLQNIRELDSSRKGSKLSVHLSNLLNLLLKSLVFVDCVLLE